MKGSTFAATTLALCTLMVCASETSARAEGGPVRVLVAVASSRGTGSEVQLKHAGDDAAHVRDVFVEAGWVKRENAFVVREATRDVLFAAIERARASLSGKRAEDVVLVFYFSGHGTASELHLGDAAVPLAELSAKLAQVPAAFRLVVTDACRTNAGADPTRVKGVTAEPAFAVNVSTPVEAKGTVWLHATADGEAAQESDELGGALFTHHWVQGLRGAADVNGDGRVTLDESYAYAHGQTLLRSSRGSGVYQRPSMRLDLRESAPVVLTHTQLLRAELELPRGTDTHYLVYGYGSHTVAAELFGLPDRAVTVTVAPGRYVVQARRGQGDGALELRIAAGEKRAIAATDFRAFPREQLVSKGGEIELRPHEISLGYGASVGGYAGYGHGGALGYGYTWDGFALGPFLTFGLGGETTPAYRSTTSELGAGVRLERRFLQNAPVSLALAIAPRVEGVWQTLRRLDADRVEPAGYAAERSSRAFAGGGSIYGAARVPVGDRVLLGLELGFTLTAAKAGDSLRAYPRGTGSLVVGFRL